MSKHLKIENLSTYRNEIYGIAAIWIMLFHGRIANIDATFPYLYKILRLGNIGVDIFLFLSGIGIFFSLSNHKDLSYDEFIKKRLCESVRNLVSLEAHASLDKSSICRNLLSILGIFCCRIFLLLLV